MTAAASAASRQCASPRRTTSRKLRSVAPHRSQLYGMRERKRCTCAGVRCDSTISRSRDLGLHGRRPVFRNLRQLAWSYFDTYVDSTGRITGYGVTNLYELGNYDWRFSPRNVWKVERHLQEIPHRAIHSSDRRYERLLARYKEFRARNPVGHLTDYASRDTWMI